MPAASADEKVLRHIVMYKFKDDVTPAQLKEVIDAFAMLPKKVDTIIGFEHGTNVSKEGKSEGFTHVFVVTFKNEADLAAYLVHPATRGICQSRRQPARQGRRFRLLGRAVAVGWALPTMTIAWALPSIALNHHERWAQPTLLLKAGENACPTWAFRGGQAGGSLPESAVPGGRFACRFAG